MLFFDILSSSITLTCYFRCHRAGSQLIITHLGICISRVVSFPFFLKMISRWLKRTFIISWDDRRAKRWHLRWHYFLLSKNTENVSIHPWKTLLSYYLNTRTQGGHPASVWNQYIISPEGPTDISPEPQLYSATLISAHQHRHLGFRFIYSILLSWKKFCE